MPAGVIPCPPELAHVTFKITQVNHATVGSALKSSGMKRLIKGNEWNALWGKLAQ